MSNGSEHLAERDDHKALIAEAHDHIEVYDFGKLEDGSWPWTMQHLADAVEELRADLVENRRALDDAIAVASANKITADALRADARSRIAALEAVIRLASEQMTMCAETSAERTLRAAPSTVLDQMIREAKAEARAVQPTDREELFQLWSRHGSSFESDSSEGYELADALLTAGWRKETR